MSMAVNSQQLNIYNADSGTLSASIRENMLAWNCDKDNLVFSPDGNVWKEVGNVAITVSALPSIPADKIIQTSASRFVSDTQVDSWTNGAFPAIRVTPQKFKQTVPSTTWTINHGLDRYPNFSIRISTSGYEGKRLEPHVQYPDENTMVLIFSQQFIGDCCLI